jgi:outer membrane protein
MTPQSLHRVRAAILGLACAVAAPVVLVPVVARAEVPAIKRIAMLDMQRVLNETSAGKKARADLEKSSKSMQEKVDKRRTKLETDAQKLGSLKGEQLADAQEKLQRESIELQNIMMTLEQELGEQHNKTLERMYNNAKSIVADMAKEKTLDLVLVRDSMTVIYAKDGLDITDEVVKRYDKLHK